MENKEFSLSRGNTLGRSLAVSVLALATYLASAKPADAQAVAATPAAAGGLEEVVVTGSHIVSRGFTAPTPVTVVGQERLEQRGITNVGEALNELPSFRAIITPARRAARPPRHRRPTARAVGAPPTVPGAPQRMAGAPCRGR